jgi:type IV pilus assembly protein PilO
MKFGIREIIFVALMVALLGGTYVFVFSKTNAKRESLNADIASMQKRLADLHAATAGIEDMNAKIDELSHAIDFFEKKLPKEKDVGDMLPQFWDMAKTNSLQSKSVKPDKPEVGPSYCELPIQMSLSGDFNGFYSFLLQLEKLPRITRITQMNLQKINDRDGEMQAKITLSIFFEPDTGGSSVAGAQ